MRNTRLANRYARSLITLAQDKQLVEVVLEDMRLIDEVCQKSHDFTLMLRSPIINADKKLSIIKAVFKDQLNELTNGFLTLLVKKGREFFLPEMTEAYVSQYKQRNHIHDVTLTTAVSIQDNLKELIKQKVKESFNKGSVELEMQTDEDLIGGFVLESGDMVYDSSIKNHLKEIKAKFTQDVAE